MKDKSNIKEIFLPTLALTIILTLTVTALIVTHDLTVKEEKSSESLIYEDKMYKQIYPDLTEITKVKLTGNEDSSIKEISETNDGSYVFAVTQKGYSSTPLVALIGISEHNKIDKLIITETKETIGLGDKVGKEKFLKNFNGKSGPFEIKKNVDAVAGATSSSKAVTNAVNIALKTFDEIKGELV